MAGHRRGINPARAGFTIWDTALKVPLPDHPRSRGVYMVAPPKSGARGGSSPLARGLPRSIPGSARAARIIPARAGFTDGAGLAPVPDAGSSPLARGLLPLVGARRCRDGIIPARAGFTHGSAVERLEIQDHPRSRGVYGWGVDIACLSCGSSPLARGLRSVPLSRWVASRIIPARAGFTDGPSS